MKWFLWIVLISLIVAPFTPIQDVVNTLICIGAVIYLIFKDKNK
jgi:hypothetical protein